MSPSLRPEESGRAVLFVLAGALALVAAIPLSIWLARPPANLTTFDRLGAEIGCVCGTCPMRPIGTCGCGFADGMLARLQEEIDGGRGDDEIMASFVAQYGTAIQIKPKSSGLDLMAWAAPMIFLMVGAVAVSAMISNWRASDAVGADAVAAAPPAEEAAEAPATELDVDEERYRALVDQELADLDA